jgi:hypothetical protein
MTPLNGHRNIDYPPARTSYSAPANPDDETILRPLRAALKAAFNASIMAADGVNWTTGNAADAAIALCNERLVELMQKVDAALDDDAPDVDDIVGGRERP